MGQFIDEVQKTNSYLTEKQRREKEKEQKQKELERIEKSLYNDFLAAFKAPETTLQDEFNQFCLPLNFEKTYKNTNTTLNKSEFQKIYYKQLNFLYNNFNKSNKSPPNDNKLIIKLYIDNIYSLYGKNAYEILEKAKLEILTRINQRTSQPLFNAFTYNDINFYENYNNKKNKTYLEEAKRKQRKKYAILLGLYLRRA